MIEDPRSYNEPGRKTLDVVDVQGLGDGLLILARELWVLTDRLAVMESVLAKRGIDITDDINSFQRDDELQASLDARGKKLVADLTNAIAGINGRNAPRP